MRKSVYSRDDVVAAGLTLARRDGFEQVTARGVAEALGASTAPVYSNFATMEQLAEAVKRAAVRELLGLMRREHTGDAFLDMGVGLLTFVWESPRLYAGLFLAAPTGYDPGLDLLRELTAVLPDLPVLAPLPQAERELVLKKVAIFTHGLATEICLGCGEDCSLDTLVLLLKEVGRAVLADAHAGHPRTTAQRALLDGLWREAADGPASTPKESR